MILLGSIQRHELEELLEAQLERATNDRSNIDEEVSICYECQYLVYRTRIVILS